MNKKYCEKLAKKLKNSELRHSYDIETTIETDLNLSIIELKTEYFTSGKEIQKIRELADMRKTELQIWKEIGDYKLRIKLKIK